MKTANEINKDIMATSLEIQKDYPELSKPIIEIHDTIPNETNPEINANTLKNYSESLNALVTKYSKEKK